MDGRCCCALYNTGRTVRWSCHVIPQKKRKVYLQPAESSSHLPQPHSVFFIPLLQAADKLGEKELLVLLLQNLFEARVSAVLLRELFESWPEREIRGINYTGCYGPLEPSNLPFQRREDAPLCVYTCLSCALIQVWSLLILWFILNRVSGGGVIKPWTEMSSALSPEGNDYKASTSNLTHHHFCLHFLCQSRASVSNWKLNWLCAELTQKSCFVMSECLKSKAKCTKPSAPGFGHIWEEILPEKPVGDAHNCSKRLKEKFVWHVQGKTQNVFLSLECILGKHVFTLYVYTDIYSLKCSSD